MQSCFFFSLPFFKHTRPKACNKKNLRVRNVDFPTTRGTQAHCTTFRQPASQASQASQSASRASQPSQPTCQYCPPASKYQASTETTSEPTPLDRAKAGDKMLQNSDFSIFGTEADRFLNMQTLKNLDLKIVFQIWFSISPGANELSQPQSSSVCTLV